MKIVFYEITQKERKYIRKKFDKNWELVFTEDQLNSTNKDLAKDADVISVFIYSGVNQEIIESSPALKLIATRSTGFNHVDTKCAQEKGISVCNVPYYGENTVAEHTFALILALSRNIHKAYVRTLRNDFSLEGLRGFDLRGKVLGVVGAGSIGMHVIKMALGFGMKIIAYDIKRNHILESMMGFNYVSLDELLGNADIITLHSPYNKGTHHLINMDNINKVKKGALFINTARSGIIQPEALYYAIDTGIFGGAGLDVFEGEELLKEENQMLTKNVAVEHLEAILKRNILLRRENVIITPHMAFDSIEAVERILDTTADNIKNFFRQEEFHRVV
jgi:D-lactate dehydrogenase